MNQPLYDLDLRRVTREHYVTGKAAVNFPSPGVTTGGWHFMSYWNRDEGFAKVSLAGIHYPDTREFFGDSGIFDATQVLVRFGWPVEDRIVYLADHYRAAADMIVRWALSESQHCNVDLDDWFPAEEDRQRLLDLLVIALPKLQELGRSEKVERWLLSQ